MNLSTGASFLGIDPAQAGATTGSINHICFGMENFDADAMVKKLAERGVKASIRLRGDTKELYFTDPDGIRVQLQDVKYKGGTGVMGRVTLIVITLLAQLAVVSAQAPAPDTLDAVLSRIGAYVAGYGARASLVVSVEKYTQSIALEGVDKPAKPRQLVAEFALVKTGDGAWVGFRDVVEVDGKSISDRRDRLVSLMTNASADVSEVTRIANESARFNVGPVVRNFNTPTTTLMLFTPANLARFAFTHKGAKTIDGEKTWEIAFKETRRPTFIMTRGGADVPVEGTLWVRPENGTVVRTRLRMRNFADQMNSPDAKAPAERPAGNPNAPSGGRAALATNQPVPELEWTKIESSGETEVTYRPDADIGLWLPVRMTEFYSGPIRGARTTVEGRATTRAEYSGYKQFGATVKINVPQ